MNQSDQQAKCIVLQIGPDKDAYGGIASVLRTYAESSLNDSFDMRFISTRSERRGWRGWCDMATGVARACWLVVFAAGDVIAHVHVSSGGSFARKSMILTVSWLRRRPSILHLHGSEFGVFFDSHGPVLRWLVRVVFRHASLVVALSPQWASWVREFVGRDDVVMLPNPVVIPMNAGVPTEPPIVLFLGRLGPRKGIPELLEAIRSVQQSGIDADWVIAGDGQVDAVRASAATMPYPERVHVPGWLDATEVRGLLESAAIYVLPSHFEGKPVALLEAMAYGLPSVVTPVGGIPDLVTDGVHGAVVPVGDVPRLAEAIRRLLASHEERVQMGSAARSLVQQHYDVSVVAVEVAAAYRTLCTRLH